jgi:predicted HTH transcriptional regulator
MIRIRKENIPVDVLEEIATLGEGYKTEFKATLPAPQSIAKSLCAFSNTKGGNLFVGINDTGTPVGVINKDYELTKLEKALPLLLPASEIDVRVLTYRSSEILFIEVKEGTDKPYYVKNGQKTQAYVRAEAVNLPANKRVLKKFIGGQSPTGTAGGLKKDEKIIFNLFEQNGQLKVSQIRDILNYSERRIKKILESLSRKGLLVPSHNEKNVYYKTKDSSLTGR